MYWKPLILALFLIPMACKKAPECSHALFKLGEPLELAQTYYDMPIPVCYRYYKMPGVVLIVAWSLEGYTDTDIAATLDEWFGFEGEWSYGEGTSADED